MARVFGGGVGEGSDLVDGLPPGRHFPSKRGQENRVFLYSEWTVLGRKQGFLGIKMFSCAFSLFLEQMEQNKGCLVLRVKVFGVGFAVLERIPFWVLDYFRASLRSIAPQRVWRYPLFPPQNVTGLFLQENVVLFQRPKFVDGFGGLDSVVGVTRIANDTDSFHFCGGGLSFSMIRSWTRRGDPPRQGAMTQARMPQAL